MLKIILFPRRHPDLSRSQFFDYLQHKHAPLVKSIPEFTEYLKRYVQNHTRLTEDGIRVVTPFRHAADRDSAIELWFDDADTFHTALGLPRYLEYIRPDEAKFNDLQSLIILATYEMDAWKASDAPSSIKLFNVLKRKEGLDRQTFLSRWRDYALVVRSDATYRKAVCKEVLNAVVPDESNPFGHAADFDGIAECWVRSSADLDTLANFRSRPPELAAIQDSFIDTERSFSVVAIEVPIISGVDALVFP